MVVLAKFGHLSCSSHTV